MLGTAVDAQVAHLLAAQRAAGEHALDRLQDHPLGETALEDLAGGAVLDAAGKAGVPVVALVGALVAGHLHLLGVDDDHVVAHVHVRRERRLVLAAEDLGDVRGEAAENDALGVDQHPLLVDVALADRIGLHLSVPVSGRALGVIRPARFRSERFLPGFGTNVNGSDREKP